MTKILSIPFIGTIWASIKMGTTDPDGNVNPMFDSDARLNQGFTDNG